MTMTLGPITAKTLPYALALGMLASACGDDDNSSPGADAGNVPVGDIDAGNVDAMPPDPCSGQPVERTDLAGLWHATIVYDGVFGFPAPLIFEQDEAGGYLAYTQRTPSQCVVLQDDILVASWQIDYGGGFIQSITARFTEIDPAGSMSGTFEQCFDGECNIAMLLALKVDPLDEPTSEGITLITEYGAPEGGGWGEGNVLTYNVRARGDLAFLARSDGLSIVDVSDPAAARERGFLAAEEGEYYNDIKLLDGPDNTLYAVMASNVRGTVVIDVTDPENPLEVTTFPSIDDPNDYGYPATVHTLFIEGTRAYLTDIINQTLLVFDLSDPANPQELGSYAHPELGAGYQGILHDLYVKDGRAYLNYWDLGMTIVDMQNPAKPVLVGEYRDYGGRTSHSNWVTQVGDRTIAIHGDEEFGAHARIVDVDPSSATFLNTLSEYQTRQAVSIHNILAHENLAFVTYYQDGLRVLDVSDPENPVKIAHYHTWPGLAPGYGLLFFEGAIGVDYNPDTKTIYVADTHRGLLVLRLDVDAP